MGIKNYLKCGIAAIAALMFVGVGTASADNTVVYERGITTAWDSTDIGANQWSVPASGTAAINNGLQYTSANNGSGYTQKTISLTANSIVTVHAVWNTGSSTGRAGNYNYLNIGDFKIKNYGQDQKGGIQVGSDEEVTIMNGTTKKADNRGATWTIDLTINQASGAIDYSITSSAGGSATGSLSHADGSYTTLRVGFERGGRTVTSNSTLNSISVSEEVQSVQTATYTVRFVDAEGTSLKDDDVRTGIVGDAITISDADKTAIYNADKTAKYAYASDDSEGKTISADGTTVVTLTFNALDKVVATINAVNEDGTVLQEGLASGTTFPGDEITIFYPKSINVDGVLYDVKQNAAEPYYGLKVSDAGTYAVTYTTADYNYFAECENMKTSRSNAVAAHGAVTGRYSSGDAVRLYRGSYLYLEGIAPGKYTITVWGRNQSRNEDKVVLTTRDANGNLAATSIDTLSWSAAASTTQTTVDATILDGTIVIKNPSDEYNNNIELDYITLTRTGDATITVSFDDEGYASFSSASAVSVDGTTVKAYQGAFTEDGSAIKLTAINEVPANTGVILRGTANGTAELTAIASADELANNVFAASVTETTVEANTVHVLSKVDDVEGFYLFSGTTIPAGKAYIPSTTASSKALGIVFDDETTGISSVKSEELKMKNQNVYNLAGQRVGEDYKGIVISNGRKYIQK